MAGTAVRHILVLSLFAVAILAALLTALPSNKGIITPAGAYEIAPRLRVPDDRRRDVGRLAFTAVFARAEASWAEVISAQISRAAEIVPSEEVRPVGVSQEEVNETNRRLIDESKPVAAAVGLRAAGFDARVTGQGAEVGGVIEGMPAEGVLHKNDVVVEVEGQPIETAADLIDAVRRRKVGDEIRLGVLRGGERLELTVGTRPATNDPARPMIGVFISTRGFDVSLPFAVDIDTDGVGGPSAGFIFALGVLDAVTEGDLMRGHYVAGTGTINPDGAVGPIGGAREKVVAAERDGAQVFLVPRDNFEEARQRARRIRVVPVERMEDAVRFLCTLEPRGDAAAIVPGPCR